jgi:hypothetical protein
MTTSNFKCPYCLASPCNKSTEACAIYPRTALTNHANGHIHSMKQRDMARPVSAEETDQEDRAYRAYLNDLHLQTNSLNPRETSTPRDDPFLNALGAFTTAAGHLQLAWEEVGSDGDHPVLTCDVYPFGDTLFKDIAQLIGAWHEAACARAFAAVGEVVGYSQEKANSIAIIAAAIATTRGLDWNVLGEFNSCVGVYLPHPNQRFQIIFGGANQTFGASVWINEGEDYTYLETNLDCDKVSAQKLAFALVTLVQQWLANGKPDWHDSQVMTETTVAAQDPFVLLNPVCVANEFGNRPGFIREQHTFVENGDLNTCIECGENEGTIRAGCETQEES